MVRIHPDPPAILRDRGCSSVGRAPALQAGGHRFDPVHLHQFSGLDVRPKRSALCFGLTAEAVEFFNNLEEAKRVD